MLKKSTLTFLEKLKNNNDRKWFAENKEACQIARKNFVDVFDEFTGKLVLIDTHLSDSVRDSHIFRMNRDVRFSLNKLPYKTCFSGYISPGGKANMDIRACYYLHIEPGNSFIGGGAYLPEKAYLEKIREHIAQKGYELQEILKSPEFQKYYKGLSKEYMLKTTPRGYAIGHSYIELLRYKSFSAMSSLTDEEVLSQHFGDIILQHAKVLGEFNNWLNNIKI